MESKPGIIEALRTLDLTMYEAQAFLSLVEQGAMTSREVSRTTGIPYSKTYEVLSRLELKGLIQVQAERPQLFRTLTPKSGLERVERRRRLEIKGDFSEKRKRLETDLKRQTAKLTQSMEAASEVIAGLSSSGRRIEATDSVVWTINGKENAVEEIGNLLPTARKKVSMILPDDDFAPFEAQMKSLSLRGVRVDVIVNKQTKGAGLPLSVPLSVYYPMHSPPTRCGIVLIDGRTAVFTDESYTTSFRTSSKSLVAVLSRFFDHEREESLPISSIAR